MPTIIRRATGRFSIAIFAAGVLTAPDGLLAMDFKVVGNQLILSGPVVGDEPGKTLKVLSEFPSIDTVILRNSPAATFRQGIEWARYSAKGALLPQYRAIAIRRAPGCSLAASGGLLPTTSRRNTRMWDSMATTILSDICCRIPFRPLASKEWIIKYCDGKADPGLVERWINIPVNIGMIHFFAPNLIKRDGVSTFMCQGTEPMARSVLGCEPIRKNALDLGITTSLALTRSNDQSELQAMLAERPKASGYAAIDDIGKVPLNNDNGLQQYRRFLAAGLPRAMAVSPDGKHWAWNAGGYDAMTLALAHCAQRSNQTCKLYAVDTDVVWTPN